MRHNLTAVLALSACAELIGVTGATSPPAVGEWIADAPTCVLERLGTRRDPLLPGRLVPAEATVRRLLTRLGGDALERAVGRRLADRRRKAAGATGLRGVSVDGKSLRGAAQATGRKIHRSPPGSTLGQRRRRPDRAGRCACCRARQRTPSFSGTAA
ncbi:hypothetical protein ACGF4C_34985 [Streptomyces sp. NPDC048197]|uniref:hypothetical protein n=1 Tax=Streptomyces sp. NPDC048197 TaxID=3365511 RepID=UPI00371AE365